MYDNVYYAIGDIHGEADRLVGLHDFIHKWHEENHKQLHKTIIHLGDYIDRGPNSYDVIHYLMALQNTPECNVINLMGNHEFLMLEAYRGEDQRAFKAWVDNGGQETLTSYEDNGFDVPDQEHLVWMKKLPSLHWDRQAGLIFVHAGIDPCRFPFENEDIRLWTRSKSFFDPAYWQSPDLIGMRVVHGHTPTESGLPDISGNGQRINIDTGACYGGVLTAAIFVPDRQVEFLYV